MFFLLVIVICTLFTILFNSLAAKLARLEVSQKEYEALLKKQFDLQQHEEPQEDVSGEVETARQSLDTAVSVYNTSIGRFPGIMAAGIFGFKAIPIEEDSDLE